MPGKSCQESGADLASVTNKGTSDFVKGTYSKIN